MIRYFVFVLIVFSSCIDKKGKLNNVTDKFESFPKEEGIVFEKVCEFTEGRIENLVVLDSFLVVRNEQSKKGKLLYNFDRKLEVFSDGYHNYGKGPEEVLSVFSIGKDKNGIWTYDVTKQRLSLIEFGNSVMTPDSFSTQMYKIEGENFGHVGILGDNKIIGQIQNEEYKAAVINYKSSKDLKYVNKFAGAASNQITYAYAANHHLLVRPQGDKVAFAYMLTDIIEIYDVKDETLISRQGPECFDIIYENVKAPNGRVFMDMTSETRNAFLAGCVTDKYIYLLYSGEAFGSENVMRGYAKCIYVFDWMGNPVRKINLDRLVSCIGVSPNDDTLFAYDINDGFIIKSELKIE